MFNKIHYFPLNIPAWLFRITLNFYFPFWGAGISVSRWSPDSRSAEVRLRPRLYNRNPLGTHFGGSLYAMCDPIYVLMLMRILGPDYLVWSQSGAILFKKPGRGVVRAVFELSPELMESIRGATDTGEPFNQNFRIEVLDNAGEVVAEVNEVIYIRKRKQK